MSETLDFDTSRIFEMYANGVKAVDIADEISVTVQTIYRRMKEHPKEHADAKQRLAMMRNAKYRRAGALSIDKQLKYLENMDDNQDTLSNEMTTIIKIGENAERRADLNEGKATEITEHKGIQVISWKDVSEQNDTE